MTTFGLPESFDAASYECLPAANTACRVPNILVQGGSHDQSSDDLIGSPAKIEPASSDIEDSLEDAYADFPLVATQQYSQSQNATYLPDMEQDLVGCLFPATSKCLSLELKKSKKNGQWTIGRHPANDLVLDGPRLSNFHCKLTWNGKLGNQSEVKLHDQSTNGTWINNFYVKKGQNAILRGGATICLGESPDAPHHEYRYIFRDVEGHSTRHAKQIWSKYDISNELGAGAFARVYKCLERATTKEYAVKIIDKSKLKRSNPDEQAVVREIAILQRLADFRHKNIVSLHEHFEERGSIYLVMELVRGGDLLSYISTHGALSEDVVRRMAAQICHAVAYFHSQGITHRDLKPENVMLTDTNPPDCKVADFGLAKLVDQHTFLKTMCGTPAYLAPEVVLRRDIQQAYDSRVDSWSLGVIFYAMLTNCAPFHETFDPQADAEAQKRYFGTRTIAWDLLNHFQLSDDGQDFLRHLLAEDPRNRKTVITMLDHHWISHLVPSDSQFQHPPPASCSPPESSVTPPTTDGAIACSQSMENLNLLDVPIPGLNAIDQDDTLKQVKAISPETVQQDAGSFESDFSVTAKIPGAFPKSKANAKARRPLAPVEETAGDGVSWNPGAPGPSRRTASPLTQTAKRKSNLIAGSSPLSSLSSSEDEGKDQQTPKKPNSRRVVTPRTKSKAMEASGNKRRGRPPSSTSRPRRGTSKDEESVTTVRKIGRPPAKTPRYA